MASWSLTRKEKENRKKEEGIIRAFSWEKGELFGVGQSELGRCAIAHCEELDDAIFARDDLVHFVESAAEGFDLGAQALNVGRCVLLWARAVNGSGNLFGSHWK